MSPEIWAQQLEALCLDEHPDDALAALGGARDRWILYRRMARQRIERTVLTDLEHSVAVAGRPSVQTRVREAMQRRTLTTPYLHAAARMVAVEWNAELRVTAESDSTAALPLSLALQCDLAVLELRDAEGVDPEPLQTAVSFDGCYRLTPMHRWVVAPTSPNQRRLVWRDLRDGRVRWLDVDAWFSAWVVAWQAQNVTLASALRAVAAEFPGVATEGGLSQMATWMETLVTHGAVQEGLS
jgi:hypothetical protein